MVFRSRIKFLKCFVLILVVFAIFSIIISRRGESETEVLIRARSRNAQRLSNLETVCKRYNLGRYKNSSQPAAFKEPPAPQYEIFFYDLKHNLSWCPIYKAGTSTWLYNLALLGGIAEDQIFKSSKQINDVVRDILPALESDRAKQALDHTLKFLVVRHPFERILSAYRDKLENVAVRGIDGTHHFYRSFGSKIVAKYRAGGNGTNSRQILKPGQYIWNEEKEPVGVEPTFDEFVKHLIDTDLRTRADDHWIPYYLFCTPCMVKYDIIGQLETMMEDQMFIIHAANLQNKIKPIWRHKTNPFSNGKVTGVSDIAKVYFSQLSRPDVANLYEKYRLDFELFGYDEKEYYKYVSS